MSDNAFNALGEEFRVTVLGSGTSAGVPVMTCDCSVCTSSDSRNRRLRSSIMLRNDSKTILVDCGSDFRQQALQWKINRLDALLLTHSHSDHISGIDELRIYNWKQGHHIDTFGSEQTLADLRQRFGYIFSPMQEGGGVPQIDLRTIGHDPFTAAGLSVLPVEVMHGRLPVTGFRFGNFGYVTDASFVPEETVEKLKGVRFLILNALRWKPHPTHLTVDQAVEIVRRIGPERAWFTHITHDLDHEETNAKLPKGIELAYDGLEFDVEAQRVD
ncbi:MAG TPA: MBL fold metallo-hydrolase [Candidatus Sumerlaeota bacterium]|nr:MBL fold metallo-hydrolase [Candidatus Sumerlaeota bacterium]